MGQDADCSDLWSEGPRPQSYVSLLCAPSQDLTYEPMPDEHLSQIPPPFPPVDDVPEAGAQEDSHRDDSWEEKMEAMFRKDQQLPDAAGLPDTGTSDIEQGVPSTTTAPSFLSGFKHDINSHPQQGNRGLQQC